MKDGQLLDNDDIAAMEAFDGEKGDGADVYAILFFFVSFMVILAL